MKTKIFNGSNLREAASLIKKGELISFPTETVYGLGANALDKNAIKKLFIVKGRPFDNPLIVHISNKDELNEIAIVPDFNKELFEKLSKVFWPGPLTIVLKKKKIIPKEVCGGLNSVAIRIPKNKIALKLIKYSGVPIAAPSANISGKPSSTCFEHVYEDFNGKIAGIIKGNICKIGIESSVVDLTSRIPVLLRPGGIEINKLRKFIPDLKLENSNKRPKSPGMKYRHYSPNAKIILFKKNSLEKIYHYRKSLLSKGKKVRIVNSSNTKHFASRLFKIFRDADKDGIDFLLIPCVEEKGIGFSIMNRLKKASSQIV